MNLSTSNSKSELFKFLKNFILFSSILIVLNIAFILILKQIPQYSKYFNITSPSDKVKVVLLSDSRGNVIKDRMLPDTVANLSFGSDSYEDLLSKMTYAVRSFPNLKTIIITIDEHCFLSYRAKYNNTDKSILFADYEFYNKVKPTNQLNFFMAKGVSQWLPLTSKKNITLVTKFLETKISGKGQENVIEKNKEWCEFTEEEREKLEKERFDFQFNTLFDPAMANTFNSICRIAEKKNIKVCGVKFPITYGYKLLMQTKSFPEIEKVLADSKIPVIDYTNDQYPECQFENQDHLNKLGADVLTAKLLSDPKLTN
jgi:hypothetical protein